MSYLDLCVVHPRGGVGQVPRLGEPLLDGYLEFVAAGADRTPCWRWRLTSRSSSAWSVRLPGR